MVKYRYKIG